MPAAASDVPSRGRDVREERLDHRLLGAGAHEVGVGTTAERDVERLEQDRLAGARLAGDDVEAAARATSSISSMIARSETRSVRSMLAPLSRPQPSFERSTS